MNNPILTSLARIGSTATSPQTISSRSSANHPPRPPSDVTTKDFRSALNKIGATTSLDLNESGISPTRTVSNPPRSSTSTTSNPDADEIVHIIGTLEQNDMSEHNGSSAQATPVMAGSPRAGLPSFADGTGTSGPIQPPPEAGLEQARSDTHSHYLISSRPSHNAGRSGDPNHVVPSYLPITSNALDSTSPTQQTAVAHRQAQQTNDSPADPARRLSPDPAKPGLPEATPKAGQATRSPASATNAASSEHRTAHARNSKQSHDAVSATPYGQAELKPDQTMTAPQITTGNLAAVVASVSAPPLNTEFAARTSPELAHVDYELSSIATSREASRPDAGNTDNIADLSTIEAPTAASASLHLSSTRLSRVEDKDSEATPPVKGSSAELSRPASHRSTDNISSHLLGEATPIRGDDAGLSIMFAATEAPPLVSPTSNMGNGLLAAKPADAPVIDSPAQAATPQTVPALIFLATRTDGTNEIRVSLNPRDLGQVDVHLVRGSDGTTTVSITASNPDTLRDLSQNVHHLHAALDAANIAPDGRTMNFIATAAATSDQGKMDLSGRGTSAQQDSGSGSSGGRDRAWQQDKQGDPTGVLSNDSSSYRSIAPVASRRSWQLSGLNITA